MALPTPDQLAGMAIAREAPAAGRPHQAQRIVEAVNRKADEGRWREGGAMMRMGPDTGQKIAARNEEIGITYDATGKKVRTGTELARYNDAKKYAARNEKFLRVGYDGMIPTEQDQLREDVLAEAASIPVIQDQLATMNINQQKDFAERILKEGRLSKEGKQIFERLLDPENKLIGDGQIFQKQDEVREAELKKNNKNQEVDELQRQVVAVEQQLNRFARDAAGAPTGADAVEIDRLRVLRPTHQAELVGLRRNLQIKERAIQSLTEHYNSSRAVGWTGRPTAEILHDLDTTRTDIDNINNDINTRESDIQKLQALEQEEQRLRQQRGENVRDLRGRELERDTFDLELRRKQIDADDMIRVRTSRETDLVNGYKNLIREAAAAAFQADLETSSQKANEELEVLKQQTADQNEKAVYGAVQTRWLGPLQHRGILRRVDFHPINRERVNADMRILMDQTQGPDQLMRNILGATRNPATNAIYTTAEINDLMNNKDFVDKMQPEVIKQLLGRRALTGGFVQEDLHVIFNSQWGAGLAEKALEKNTEFRNLVEGALGVGALRRPGFLPRFGEEMRKHPSWWLLLLGAPIMFAAGAMRTVAGQESIST
ncbi:hypothetical protein HYT17_03615 [Candidatus Microgenomates bacterium]|nr:hypothetical protein [Candidatus Microgenomates bacterium]